MSRSEFLIGVDELHRHLGDSGWRVVDCRFELPRPDKGFADYLAGHIPGAVYAHLDRDLAAPRTAASGRHPLPSADVFARTLGRWGITPATRVVVYDQGGGAIAARLWWMLGWVGHRSVRLLDGGFSAWQRAGLPLSTEVPAITAAEPWEAASDDNIVVSTGEVLQALHSGTPLALFDARDAARFEGKTEPIDPVAGHIPGARSFPFGTSLNADGSWRSGQELKEAWSSALEAAGRDASGETGPGNAPRDAGWAVMCGSGVTACHLALSAALAGIPEPRLYVGSWSEWIRDGSRPVATGPADADDA